MQGNRDRRTLLRLAAGAAGAGLSAVVGTVLEGPFGGFLAVFGPLVLLWLAPLPGVVWWAGLLAALAVTLSVRRQGGAYAVAVAAALVNGVLGIIVCEALRSI